MQYKYDMSNTSATWARNEQHECNTSEKNWFRYRTSENIFSFPKRFLKDSISLKKNHTMDENYEELTNWEVKHLNIIFIAYSQKSYFPCWNIYKKANKWFFLK